MSKGKNIIRKKVLLFRLFFRRYPAFPYLLKWLAISAVLGGSIGSASALFLITLEGVTRFREAHQWIIWLLPAAGLLTGLLYHYWGKAVAGGNNLLLEAIHTPEGLRIPFRMALFVYGGTLLTHLFGGSAGREGTALQMAGAIADRFTALFRLRAADRQVVLIAAVSAGFGSVFGTPLAGFLFGLEAFTVGRLRYHALLPALLSSLLADAITRLWPVSHTHYTIAVVPPLGFISIIYSLIAGAAFGIVAALFIKGLHYCTRLFNGAISYPPLRPVAGGIIIAAGVGCIGTRYIGLGIPAIVQAISGPISPYDFLLKIVFTVLTLGAGFKGGEVTPLFFIGAALGNALSLFIPLPTGLLAGMGFVAVFAGATNTPLACTFMAIELFGNSCSPYAAIACIMAYLFSGHNSIYSSQRIGEPKHIRFNGSVGKRFSEL